MPKISIAMCTYNGALYIIEQLKSFEQQTHLPDEIIICDDGSKDQTIALINEYAETTKIPLRLYCNQRNLGYSENFSQAISLATGDIVFLSDQDDIWHPLKVEKFLEAFEQQPDSLVIFSDANLVDEKLEPFGKTLWQLLNFDQTAQSWMLSPQGFELTLQRGNIFCGSSMALRQALKEISLPLPMGCPHDLWFGMLSTALGKVSLIDEPLNDYRQHAQQTTGQKQPGFLSALTRLYKGLQCFRNVALYERWLLEHEALRDRLLEITTYPIDANILDMLDAKITYLRSQIQLRQRPFFSRPPILYREWVSGRYFRFSHGLKHLVVDLLL